MFFVLHADVCGVSIPHHGHSHGGNHGHSHGDDYERLDDSKHNHAHDNKHTTKNYNSLNGENASGQKVEKVSKQSDNINVRAAIIHVIGDFVQSVGVLVAAILIKIKVCSKKLQFNNLLLII
jgi:zinc transporter 2